MSRPFSYNDENFTVIGNVLFCHIEIKERILSGFPIVEIPPEIFDHMLFYNQRLNKVGHSLRVTSYSCVDVGIKVVDKKYVMYCNNDIYETGLYLVGFYILKDI